MKTIKKGEEIVRKDDIDAEVMVKKHGWSYCKKAEWKKQVRDKNKKVAPKEEPKAPASPKSDGKKRSKYRDKKEAMDAAQIS